LETSCVNISIRVSTERDAKRLDSMCTDVYNVLENFSHTKSLHSKRLINGRIVPDKSRSNSGGPHTRLNDWRHSGSFDRIALR
jgi:hypothetical protein